MMLKVDRINSPLQQPCSAVSRYDADISDSHTDWSLVLISGGTGIMKTKNDFLVLVCMPRFCS